MSEHNSWLFPRELLAADGEEIFQAIRWPDGILCPDCGSDAIGTGHHPKRQSFRCGIDGCRRTFSVTSGTPLEDTRLSLNKWVEGFHLLAMNGAGRGAPGVLGQEIDVTYKTAYRMVGLLRVSLEEGLGVLVDPVRDDVGFYTLGEWEKIQPLKHSETRTRIVIGLNEGPAMPHEISRELDPITEGPGHHHLRVLEQAGIVATDQFGRVQLSRPLPSSVDRIVS